MATSKLNNSLAYRFIDVKMIEVLTRQFNESGIKFSIPTSKSTSKDKVRDITICVELDGEKYVCSPTICYGNTYIGISQHKMMYSKNILTITEGNIYIISIDKLRMVWNDRNYTYINPRKTYLDGNGTSSLMSRFKIEYVKSEADYVIPMDDTIYNDYMRAYDAAGLGING